MGHTQSCTLNSSMSFGVLTEIVPLDTEKSSSLLTDAELSTSFQLLENLVVREIEVTEEYLLWLDGQRRKAKLPLIFGQLDQVEFVDRACRQADKIMKEYLPTMIQLAKIQGKYDEVKKMEEELHKAPSMSEISDMEPVKIDLRRVDFMRLEMSWTLELAHRVLAILQETKDLSGSKRYEEISKFLQPFLNLKEFCPQIQDSALMRLDPMPTVPAIAEWGFSLND